MGSTHATVPVLLWCIDLTRRFGTKTGQSAPTDIGTGLFCAIGDILPIGCHRWRNGTLAVVVRPRPRYGDFDEVGSSVGVVGSRGRPLAGSRATRCTAGSLMPDHESRYRSGVTALRRATATKSRNALAPPLTSTGLVRFRRRVVLFREALQVSCCVRGSTS